ncbi:MAG TPA: phage holin family protein [Verrucomicrobiae bacterium]|jgi:putative membrane protein|nr:phage holin family protein [Verrucomicrobiae bacterium]
MSPGTKSFLQRWFVTTLGVLAAAGMVRGIHAGNVVALLAASFLLGLLNAFIRPILLVLALPLLIVTLGLFAFVINAILLYFVSALVKDFYVADFWTALKGSVLISIVSMLANAMFGVKHVRVQTAHQTPMSRPPRPPDTGGGPVIDV